ncbi:hypothetical protein GGF46_003070 [Coemansia sp. RSA 552]|nr:hypothetical protein GGF46_003070 [Coemansia sp. RSA 552]
MMSALILTRQGDPYSLRGFQSLSGNKTLALRTGSAPKHTPQDYVAPRWCPGVDVLAVPEGRMLRLVRLSGGQTIWRRALSDSGEADQKPNAQTIAAIAWGPSGTSIAVLHGGGLLVQRDFSRGDIINEARIDLDERVVGMEWVACKGAEGGGETDEDSLEAALPLLSMLDRSQPLPSHVNPVKEPPTAVVITGASGTVRVCLGGVFALPTVHLPVAVRGPGQEAGYVAVDARLDQDASSLNILLVEESSPQILARCSLDTSILSSYTTLLQTLMPLSARLSGLCLYLDNALGLLVKESEAREEGASRAFLRTTFEDVLRDHGVDEATSPEAELSRLAVTGRASESTSQFLLAKLKTTRLRNWENAGRLGAVAITRLVYQHAQPAIERAILAATRLLQVIKGSALHPNGAQGTSPQLESACGCILRAVVVLGWLYARLDEYMAQVHHEQQLNQEFVDWALFSISDLHWQNEGSRRLGNDDGNDDDDGLRPVCPDIDYKALLGFIRSAFRRVDEFAAPPPSVHDVLQGSGNSRPMGSGTFADTYFDVLVEQANLQTIGSAEGGSFEYVFHSQEAVDAAIGRHGSGSEDMVAPTCREALDEVRRLISTALEWPALSLGQSLQWSQAPTPICPLQHESCNEVYEILSDMRAVAEAGQDGIVKHMYMAVVEPAKSQLLLIARSEVAGGGQQAAAYIDLTVDVQLSDVPSRSAMDVSAISFFDDQQLGVVFTVDGCNAPLDVAREEDASVVVFSQLRRIDQASAQHALVLSCNGNEGRRCVAVAERRGKSWWPFDMDNEEDDEDEE